MTTEIKVQGLGQSATKAVSELAAGAVGAADIDRILDNAQAVVLNRIRTRFRKAQNPDGSPWPESKAAAIRKAGGFTWSNGKKVTGGDTLFATGTLWHSIYAYKKGARTRAITFDQRKAPYGRYHQLGTSKLPERRFIAVTQDDANVVTAVLQRQFTGRG